MAIIILFIVILNIVSIVLMYYSLKDIEKKEKLIFIVIGTAIMYALTSLIYWLSTKNIEITDVSDLGKDLITFAFVPINAIVVLPLFAKSYYSYKMGNISGGILRNRGIVLGIILLIILIIECSYFENIQKQVVEYIKQSQELQENEADTNTIGNTLSDDNTFTNSNEITNIVEVNNVDSNLINESENNTANITEQINSLEDTNALINQTIE